MTAPSNDEPKIGPLPSAAEDLPTPSATDSGAAAAARPLPAVQAPPTKPSQPSFLDRTIRQGVKAWDYLLVNRGAVKRWAIYALGAIGFISLFQNSQTVTYDFLWWELAFPQVVLSVMMMMVGITIGIFGYRAVEGLDSRAEAYGEDTSEMAPFDPFSQDD